MIPLSVYLLLSPLAPLPPSEPQAATAADPSTSATSNDHRLDWFRDARFGMFIHWGLYAIPAGERNGETSHAEWIRDTAKIPLEEYDNFVGQFNPVKFDADKWVRMAKDAGIKYIVITSKHHDGFCLFDSKFTDFDVMSTPFKRDIMAELAAACRKHDLRICWYHSIMDWHHPDYLPRRPWEKTRSTDGADFDRYVGHLRNQLKELLTNYGPIGILWFDGEWEDTWTHAYGGPLYDYVRNLQPNIIVNNRVDKGRSGMAGMTAGDHKGDYGTPEQEIPATGFPGVDWESCMTMNDHWGYNKADKNFKSAKEMIRMLVDVASKGGNLLMNVGPTAEGEIPPESIERLAEMGKWMKVNGESIYGTRASPFKSLAWGRCTQKNADGGNTRLYLHVFDWPKSGRLSVPGLLNEIKGASLLADKKPLASSRDADGLLIDLPPQMPDATASVIVLDVVGPPDIANPPIISAASDIFVGELDVSITSDRQRIEIRYSTDGSDPAANAKIASGPVRLTQTATVSARAFRDGKPVSGVAKATFTKVAARPAEKVDGLTNGITFEYYEGDWKRVPDFGQLKPLKTGVMPTIDFSPRKREEQFAFRYRGFVKVPTDGVYAFYTQSDDGSQLFIGDKLVVDNDGLHSSLRISGQIALAAGHHAITVTFFERTGSDELEVGFSGPGIESQRIPPASLFTKSAAP